MAGAAKRSGCSHQYDENSVRETLERIKGGAVREERSPLKEAMDYGSGVSWRRREGGRRGARRGTDLQEGRPAARVGSRRLSLCLRSHNVGVVDAWRNVVMVGKDGLRASS